MIFNVVQGIIPNFRIRAPSSRSEFVFV